MKNILVLVVIIFISFSSSAQSFTGTIGAIPDNNTEICFDVNVTDIGNLNCNKFELTMKITHRRDDYLDVLLI